MTSLAFLRADLATVVLRGGDRESWLNGLVTCDVAKLSLGAVAYGLAVSLKGRVLADLYVHKGADAVTLFVPASAVDELLTAFDKHLVMEDVELERPAAEPAIVEVLGPCLAFEGEVVSAPADVLHAEGCLAWGDLAAITAVTGPLGDERAREALRLARGVPRFAVDFGPDTYPQEAGLETRAVSFSKGCYFGQEVVCMLEMRGHVKRKLVHLVVQGDAPIERGSVVTSDAGEIGTVTSAHLAPEGGQSYALAMAKLKSLGAERARGSLRIGSRGAKLVTPPERASESAHAPG